MAFNFPVKLSDNDKELFESLWNDLIVMYQRDLAMADNGIHFRDRVESFINEYASQYFKEEKILQSALPINIETPKCPSNVWELFSE